MDQAKPPRPEEATPPTTPKRTEQPDDAKDRDKNAPNPPYTTKNGVTAPKFGSAGSGGAEVEPGPERD